MGQTAITLVRVYFEANNHAYTYLNDRFDLKVGDIVFVEGRMEKQRGRVEHISRSFKVRASDYKRVIAAADTHISGKYNFAGSYLAAFDKETLSYAKVRSWYLPPEKEEDIFLTGSDDSFFMLDDLRGMNVREEIAERGIDYYQRDRVRFIGLDGDKGRAIVEGTEPYEVEFLFKDGRISELVCGCYCDYTCKHCVAAMLQLREILEVIRQEYAEEFAQKEYFAAVDSATLLRFAIDGRTRGSLTFSD